MLKKILIAVIAILIIVVLSIGIFYLLSNQKDNERDNPAEAERNCTTYNGGIEEQCTEEYVGLAQEEAIDKAEDAGLVPKINKIDGKVQLNTAEGSTPIYFEIEDDLVTQVYFERDVPISD